MGLVSDTNKCMYVTHGQIESYDRPTVHASGAIDVKQEG